MTGFPFCGRASLLTPSAQLLWPSACLSSSATICILLQGAALSHAGPQVCRTQAPGGGSPPQRPKEAEECQPQHPNREEVCGLRVLNGDACTPLSCQRPSSASLLSAVRSKQSPQVQETGPYWPYARGTRVVPKAWCPLCVFERLHISQRVGEERVVV